MNVIQAQKDKCDIWIQNRRISNRNEKAMISLNKTLVTRKNEHHIPF